MISAIIVDDEQKNITTLSALLRDYCPQVSVLDTADNAATAKKLIESLKPQLLFLDVEMPYGSGFDLLQSLPKMEQEVIFITAFDQYAINAFRYAALDYLLKPVNIEQLEAAVKRAEQRIEEKKSADNYGLLLQNMLEKDNAKQSIVVADKGEQYFIKLADIKYILANGSYTHIYTGTRSFVSTKNLVDYENMLPGDIFCRIHKGHIVNRNYIDKIKNGRGGSVLMTDGRELEIAIRRKADIMKMFNR